MLITETIKFNRETLDTSIESFVKLNYGQCDLYNLEYYIIMKRLIEYLKLHPESIICNKMSTSKIITKLRSMCIKRWDGARFYNEFDTFKNNKITKLSLKEIPYYSINFFIIWYIIDTIINQLEQDCLHGRYIDEYNY